MEITRFELGPFATNTYLIYKENSTFLIDAGTKDLVPIFEKIERDKKKIESVLITHAHYDHIFGLEELIKYNPNIKIYIGESELKVLKNPQFNLSFYTDHKFKFDFSVLNIKTISEKNNDYVYNAKILDVPGHTCGSVAYYFEEEKVCFAGDLIFELGIGRTDFPTADFEQIEKSIRKIFDLDNDIVIYPGHGDDFFNGDRKNKRII